MDSTPDDLLKTADVANLLGVTRQHVYSLIDAGKLAHVRIGPSTIRVRRSVLEAFLAAATVPAVAAVSIPDGRTA